MAPLRTVSVLLFFGAALVNPMGRAVGSDGSAKLLAEARATARRGSYPDALEKLNEALELARESNDALTEAILLDNMGEVHRLQGNPSEARYHYTQALKIYQEIDHELGVQSTKKKLVTLTGQKPGGSAPPPPPEPFNPTPEVPIESREKLIDNAIDRIRDRVKGQEIEKETDAPIESDSPDTTAAIPRSTVAEPTPAPKEVEKETYYATYLRTIKESIVRAWKYPEEASDEKEQGKVDVEFAIQKDGNLQDIQILRSSGYSALDREAVRAVGAASPFKPIPDQIGVDQLSIRFTFNYTLDASRNAP